MPSSPGNSYLMVPWGLFHVSILLQLHPQFIEGQFKEDSAHTIGVEFGSKIVPVGGKTVKLQIWDTAGQVKSPTETSALKHEHSEKKSLLYSGEVSQCDEKLLQRGSRGIVGV